MSLLRVAFLEYQVLGKELSWQTPVIFMKVTPHLFAEADGAFGPGSEKMTAVGHRPAWLPKADYGPMGRVKQEFILLIKVLCLVKFHSTSSRMNSTFTRHVLNRRWTIQAVILLMTS